MPPSPTPPPPLQTKAWLRWARFLFLDMAYFYAPYMGLARIDVQKLKWLKAPQHIPSAQKTDLPKNK